MVVDKVADMLADKEIIMLIIGRLGFGGVSQMLTIDDEGGGEVQEPLILADVIWTAPNIHLWMSSLTIWCKELEAELRKTRKKQVWTQRRKPWSVLRGRSSWDKKKWRMREVPPNAGRLLSGAVRGEILLTWFVTEDKTCFHRIWLISRNTKSTAARKWQMLPLQLISWGELLSNLNSAPKSLLVAIKRETLIWHNLRACSSDGQPGLHKYKSIFPGKNSFWSLKVFLKGRFFRNELYYFHCVWPLPREGRASYDSCIGCLVKRGRCTIICLHYGTPTPSKMDEFSESYVANLFWNSWPKYRL